MSISIHIILPCAGEGTRLGLNYPKELYEIRPGFRLIDFSLTHIRKAILNNSITDFRISIVIRKGKESIVEYVKSQFPDSDIRYIYNDIYYEWPGSIFAAYHSNQDMEHHLVFLPDSMICLSEDDPFSFNDRKNIFDITQIELSQASFLLGIKRINQPDLLKNLGACFVDTNRNIIRYKDKPLNMFSEYNSFWGVMAFNRMIGDELYSFLKDNVKKEYQLLYENCSFYPAKSFDMSYYIDFGTWESINASFNHSLIDKYLSNIQL